MLALMLVVVSFAIPLGGVSALEALNRHDGVLTFGQYMTAYLFYLVQYFVIFFFNTALLCSSFEITLASFCNSSYRSAGSVNSRTV